MSKAMTRWRRGDALVVHQRAVLPAVGARGVQAQQRRALARFLDIDAVMAPEQIEMHVAADDRLESRAHAPAPAGAQFGQRFLEVAQIGHEDLQIAFGLQHPPLDQRHQVVGARRRPAHQNFCHSSSGARSAKDDDGITNGPGVTDTTLPSKIEISQAVVPTSSRKVVVRNRPRRTSASSAIDPRLQRLDHLGPPLSPARPRHRRHAALPRMIRGLAAASIGYSQAHTSTRLAAQAASSATVSVTCTRSQEV